MQFKIIKTKGHDQNIPGADGEVIGTISFTGDVDLPAHEMALVPNLRISKADIDSAEITSWRLVPRTRVETRSIGDIAKSLGIRSSQ